MVGLHIDCILYLNLRQESQSEALKTHHFCSCTTSLFGLNDTQWRVKDFPDGERAPIAGLGQKAIIWQDFGRKLYKN